MIWLLIFSYGREKMPGSMFVETDQDNDVGKTDDMDL